MLRLTDKQKLDLVITAVSLLGVRYKYGAEVDLNVEPENVMEIDCSELVEFCYRKIGYIVPDGACNQFEASEPVALPILYPEVGDLAFMRRIESGKISHVGLYVGRDKIIHASGFHNEVVITPLSEFQKKTKYSEFAGIRRFLEDKVKNA